MHRCRDGIQVEGQTSMCGTCMYSLVYLGHVHVSVTFALLYTRAPCFLPLVARFHNDLLYSDHTLLIGAWLLVPPVVLKPM